MKHLLLILLISSFVNLTAGAAVRHAATFNGQGHRSSAGDTRYFIDPVNGSDLNTGKLSGKAWKSFAPLSGMTFSAGDRISILRPGSFDHSLIIRGVGTVKKPILIEFAKGRYDIYDKHSYRKKLNITNTNDVPDGLKAIAILISHSKNIKVTSAGARIVLHAKMIETCIDSSENVKLEGLGYDYNTPTVSEFTVSELQEDHADLTVSKDTHYTIRDSVLYWRGDGWEYRNSWYWQSFEPATRYVTRTGLSFDRSKFSEIAGGKLRVFFSGDPGLRMGYTYQTRDVSRDCAGIFLQRSKNIYLKNIRIYFMHGMGVVSQFCDNVTLDGITVKPDASSDRTCAAWADILHFAGCKGLIEVRNSYLSAANDDAINVHGVHLRIVGRPAPDQIKVRFMHGQTYGFDPYAAGDSIALVNGKNLIPFANNVVKCSVMLNEKEILLTLEHRVDQKLREDDAVENITWTPRVNIYHNTITSIPTRAILATTRRRTVIHDNKFLRVSSAGVLVEDDAEGWYESGPVTDLRISNNYFFKCGEPAINIHPENTIHAGPVHRNILITNNEFILNGGKALFAKSTSDIRFNTNTIRTQGKADINSLTGFENCTGVNTGQKHHC